MPTDPLPRYQARVAEHLETFSSDAGRLLFLRGQFARFEQDFREFQRRARRDEANPAPGESAWSYRETLDWLSTEIGKFERRAA